ncbi:MAG TPA: dihydropteroate synthase [Thermodesulfobacteriota bacterium]|nr:dihydropteroate synthase [Thermodesulfobacteriota bacterium]
MISGLLKQNRTLIMGILNVTPDSFYDGGKYISLNNALKHSEQLIEDGADIIDIGGESTRPGSNPVSENDELNRVIPVIAEINKKFKIPISVDTTKAQVARQALDNGASIVNDISGLNFEPQIADIVSKYNASIVLCHTSSRPVDMQTKINYDDLILNIYNYLQDSIKLCEHKGINSDNIYIDPGFGFGKSVKDNLLLLKSLPVFKKLNKKILVGTSMKSFIGKTLGTDSLEIKSDGTFATVVISILNGADIVRVHDVKKMKTAVKMTEAVINIQ